MVNLLRFYKGEMKNVAWFRQNALAWSKCEKEIRKRGQWDT